MVNCHGTHRASTWLCLLLLLLASTPFFLLLLVYSLPLPLLLVLVTAAPALLPIPPAPFPDPLLPPVTHPHNIWQPLPIPIPKHTLHSPVIWLSASDTARSWVGSTQAAPSSGPLRALWLRSSTPMLADMRGGSGPDSLLKGAYTAYSFLLVEVSGKPPLMEQLEMSSSFSSAGRAAGAQHKQRVGAKGGHIHQGQQGAVDGQCVGALVSSWGTQKGPDLAAGCQESICQDVM